VNSFSFEKENYESEDTEKTESQCENLPEPVGDCKHENGKHKSFSASCPAIATVSVRPQHSLDLGFSSHSRSSNFHGKEAVGEVAGTASRNAATQNPLGKGDTHYLFLQH